MLPLLMNIGMLGPPPTLRVSRHWAYRYPHRKRDIHAARERFGIPDETVVAIHEIAVRQADTLSVLRMDEQQRFEELNRELKFRGIEWQAKYLEALNTQRERLIDAELAERFRLMLGKQKIVVLLMLLAASV